VIYLGSDEIKYMLMMLQLTPDLRQVLEQIARSGGKVDEDQADELRDLCNDQLDLCGYDESYKLNDDGKKLESLVDKLFIG
jgi:hypothetical protein